VGGAILCTECHNMANGTTGALNHFKFLNTALMEGPASQTIQLQVTSGTAVYNPAAGGGPNCTTSTFTCHTQGHDSGDRWQ
jgi:hypothetical protein